MQPEIAEKFEEAERLLIKSRKSLHEAEELISGIPLEGLVKEDVERFFARIMLPHIAYLSDYLAGDDLSLKGLMNGSYRFKKNIYS